MVFSVPGREEIIELTGKLGLTEIGRGLMHTVLEVKEKADEGRIIKEAINQGLGGFVPDIVFEQLVKNYGQAEKMYGKTFVNLVSGFDADYVGRNIKIPEFRKELEKRIAEKIQGLKNEGFLDEDYSVTEKGIQLAALVSYIEELEAMVGKGLLGEQPSRKRATYGEKGETHVWRKGDRYRDIALRQSVLRAVKRGRGTLILGEFETHERKSPGNLSIIYGVDASGSMKGEKLDLAKKAGIGLAFKAIEERNNVGLVVFSSDVKQAIAPTQNFGLLLRTITAVRAARETDIVKMLTRAIDLFPRDDGTKHVLLLTDALPTAGEKPEEESIEAASVARNHGITISIIGINLDKKGENFARRIVEVGEGRFYVVRNMNQLDRVVLEDYWSL